MENKNLDGGKKFELYKPFLDNVKDNYAEKKLGDKYFSSWIFYLKQIFIYTYKINLATGYDIKDNNDLLSFMINKEQNNDYINYLKNVKSYDYDKRGFICLETNYNNSIRYIIIGKILRVD